MMKRLEHFLRIHCDMISSDDTGIKYKLFPGGDADRFYDELTNDNTRPRAERRLAEKVDRLAKECEVAYKEYRSNIRETLFL